MKNIENKIKGNTFVEKLIIENIESEMNGLYEFFESDLPKKKNKEDSLEKEQIKFLLEHINFNWNLELKQIDKRQFLAGICEVAKETNCTKELSNILSGNFNMHNVLGV